MRNSRKLHPSEKTTYTVQHVNIAGVALCICVLNLNFLLSSLHPSLLSPWYSRATNTSQTPRYIVVFLNLNDAANNTMLKEAALKVIGSLSKNDMV